MHIALGYRWFPTAVGYHLERALYSLGHTVTYVGLPCAERPGYDSAVPLTQIIAALPQPPDLFLWIDPAGRYFPPGIEDLSIPTTCYLVDVHLGTWRHQVARFFDAVFVAQKDYLARYQQAVEHAQVYWLPLAAAPDVHRQLDLPKLYDVGFVGNLARAHRGTARARRLRLIAERFRTNDFDRQYTPEQVGQVYSQSRIVFNTSIAGDVTMRVFEGTACGTLVITDSVANGLSDLFEIGNELVTYADEADLVNKIAYYIEQTDERERIARAGHKRALAQHTYAHRMQTMLGVLATPSFKRSAPMRQAAANARRAARQNVYTHLHMLDTILDAAQAADDAPLLRVRAALPCLIRRLLV